MNIWVDHPDFLDIVQSTWNEEVIGNPLYILHEKIKKTCEVKSSCSRQAFGDFYEEPKRLERQIRALEHNSVTNNTGDNNRELSRLKAEFTKFLELQAPIVKQKARVKWLEEGDSNTAYFHNIIEDGRKRLNIRKIMDEHNNWLEENDKIVEGAMRFYPDYSSLNLLPRCITEEDNDMLCTLPTLKEPEDCVFSLDPDSAPGPDGLSGYFYQSTWRIIGSDLHKAMTALVIYLQNSTLILVSFLSL